MEEWKDIEGFEEKYQVSNLGRIRRKDNLICLTLTHDRISGYQKCTLYDGTKYHYKLVHRVVATAFLNNELQKAYVHHIDEDKENNKSINLMWVTAKEHGALSSKEHKERFIETYKRNKLLREQNMSLE